MIKLVLRKGSERGRKSGLRAAPEKKPMSRDGTKLIGGHFPRETAKEFKVLAAERDMTCQELLREAINDIFAKYGRPPRV